MSLHRKVAINTTVQVIGKIISAVAVLVATSLITRYLGAKGYGEYSTAIVFLSFFGVIADMGLYTILAREISQEGADQDKIISNIFTLRIIADIITFSLVPLIALSFNYSSITKQTIAVGALAFLFVSSAQVLQAVFQKELRVDKIAITEIVGKTVFLVVSIMILKCSLDKTSRSFMGAMVLADGAIFVLTLLLVRKYAKISFKFDYKYWKHIL